jgi:circadian clock protein KaiC
MPGGSGFALHTLVHGVIGLEYLTPEFGPYRRRLRVRKLRNTQFQEGFHDFEIRKGGITLYPRLIAAVPDGSEAGEQVTTGIDGLDAILVGGVDRGTSTLLLGSAGSGKSSLATRMALAALERGEQVAVYLFDERLPVLIKRSLSLGMDLRPYLGSGQLVAYHINPLELSPGKFSHMVREAVARGVSTVIVDSLTGYVTSMGDEAGLMLQIRSLLTFLGARGVTTILVSVQHGLLEPTDKSAAEASYLADTVILLRYYEFCGDVRRAVSVFKRRAGAHFGTIQDIEFTPSGARIGSPLRQFQGVLTGVPTLQDDAKVP